MIAAALLEQGVPIEQLPEDLLPAELWAVAAPYARAFGVLSSARGFGQAGPLPIAYSEIIAYARANGFAGSIAEREEFVELIQEQDSAYLANFTKKKANQ